MEKLRTVVHLCFDAATSLLYTASIAVAVASAMLVGTQRLAPALSVAATAFLALSALCFYRLWRKYHAPL